ncbi:MAG: type III PLP-dependent enzyme [Chloroflexota bacterium]
MQNTPINPIDKDFFRRTQSLETPSLVIDLEQVRSNYAEISAAFPGVDVHYAMKCNPDPGIIGILHDLKSSFEIASLPEATQLLQQGVHPDNIICMHPIKSPEFLKYLHEHQIKIMAIDCFEEVDKIAQYAPGSQIVVRLDIPNDGSVWHLDGKYGLPINECLDVLHYIESKGLIAHGLVFHVGSQCETPSNWINALKTCERLWSEAREQDIVLKFLSLGGGLPVQYRRSVPSLQEIGTLIMSALQNSIFLQDNDVQFAIEPGRFMVATAGTLITSVFGTAKRGSLTWAYIETGSYNGLVEAIETDDRQFYPLIVEHTDRPLVKYHIGGPSCVSLDTPFENVELPELRLGDRLYVLNTGAYTVSCATSFNGFRAPNVHYLHDLAIPENVLSVAVDE